MAGMLLVEAAEVVAKKVVSPYYRETYLDWRRKPYSSHVLSIIKVFTAFVIVYLTWSWGSPLGGIVRLIVALSVVHVCQSWVATVVSILILIVTAPLELLQDLFSKSSEETSSDPGMSPQSSASPSPSPSPSRRTYSFDVNASPLPSPIFEQN